MALPRHFRIDRSAQHQPLLDSAQRLKESSLKQFFAADASRLEDFTLEVSGIYADFSKNLIDRDAMKLLHAMAKEAGVGDAIEALFSGEHINETEDRAVLHTALRGKTPLVVDGQNIREDVDRVLADMKGFVENVRSGEFTGFSGKQFTDVVNIGIGGSDLGPVMVCEALSPKASLRSHFVSNVDGADLAATLALIDPETTLFIVVSKTFTTQETLANAEAAKSFIVNHYGDESCVSAHFAAVSTNLAAVSKFGIDPNNTFGFWDWVGGRYSLWGAVGISIALTGGWSTFEQLLAGAKSMDDHFSSTSFEKNLPVTMALIGVWYRNYMDYSSLAVIPYSHHLRRFPAYLQQTDMESNGKRVDRAGRPIQYATGPVIWGEPGTNGQHAFFQLLHQGSDVIPVDFIAVEEPLSSFEDHHRKLLANCFAQSEALMNGKSEEEVRKSLRNAGENDDVIDRLAPYKTFPGNRPSTTFMIKRLDAFHLGALIAAYEHKVFVQGVIWNVFSYDQWGVELGKELAKRILPALSEGVEIETDASTKALIKRAIRSSRTKD